jgi:hypothetical protein
MAGQMTDISLDPLEILWDALLSREPLRVLAAFADLLPDDQASVYRHLQRMAAEDGWHPEQRASALAALKALNAGSDGETQL